MDYFICKQISRKIDENEKKIQQKFENRIRKFQVANLPKTYSRFKLKAPKLEMVKKDEPDAVAMLGPGYDEQDFTIFQIF